MNKPTHGTSAQSRAILTVIVTNGERGNTYTVVAVKLPPHDAGTPPHRHAHHAESCYLVDGLLALTCDGYTTTLTPGAAALIPPNVLHTYWNPSAAPTTMLLIYRCRKPATTYATHLVRFGGKTALKFASVTRLLM